MFGPMVETSLGCAKRGRARNAFDSPVHDIHLAKRAHHDVLRLEVTMNDVAVVSKGEDLGHASNHAKPIGERRWPASVAVKPFARDQFHRVVKAPVGQSTRFINRNNGGMFQVCDEPRLTGERAIQHLQCDLSIQVAVVRCVNHPHATTANLPSQNITRCPQIWQSRHVPQVVEKRITQIHSCRISSRNSHSLDVTPRILSVTSARSVRRAQARWLVTAVSVILWRCASSA